MARIQVLSLGMSDPCFAVGVGCSAAEERRPVRGRALEGAERDARHGQRVLAVLAVEKFHNLRVS